MGNVIRIPPPALTNEAVNKPGTTRGVGAALAPYKTKASLNSLPIYVYTYDVSDTGGGKVQSGLKKTIPWDRCLQDSRIPEHRRHYGPCVSLPFCGREWDIRHFS